MKIYFFKSLKSNFKYNTGRSILTGIGVFIGIASVIIITTISNSFSSYLLNSYTSKITIGLSDSFDSGVEYSEVIKRSEVKNSVSYVKTIKGVNSFEPVGTKKVIDVKLADQTWQYGIAIEFTNNVSISEGVGFGDSPGNVVVVYDYNGEGFEPSYHLNDLITISGIAYKIIGITADSSGTIYFPKRLENVVDYELDNDIASYYLEIEEGYDQDIVIENVLSEMNSSLEDNLGFENYSAGDREMIKESFSTLSIFLSLIAAISLVVAAVNVINIMYISTLERQTEVAIYRSLGMSKRMVLYLFLIESFILVVTFAILGYLFGILTSVIILALLGISLHIPLYSVLLILMISIVVGIGSGLKPAINAANISPAILLR